MANIQITATYQSGRTETHYAKGPKTLEKILRQLNQLPTVTNVKTKDLDKE